MVQQQDKCDFRTVHFLCFAWPAAIRHVPTRLQTDSTGVPRPSSCFSNEAIMCKYSPNIWLKILSKFTSFFFSRYLCITLRTLEQKKNGKGRRINRSSIVQLTPSLQKLPTASPSWFKAEKFPALYETEPYHIHKTCPYKLWT